MLVARDDVEIMAAEGSVAVDGPTLFLWGTILLLSFAGVLLMAERSVDPAGDAFAPQAAALPGSEGERQALAAGLRQSEVLPLAMFAVGGMLLFPASADLLTMFVALEVLSLPLYVLCALARRRRLLSQEAGLKYFMLGAFSSAFFLFGAALLYGYAGTVSLSGIADAVGSVAGQDALLLRRDRPDRRRPAVQGGCGAVPLLDAGRLPGCADADHRVHGRRDQGGRVRRPAAGVLRRARRNPLGLAADDVDHRDRDHGRRVAARA